MWHQMLRAHQYSSVPLEHCLYHALEQAFRLQTFILPLGHSLGYTHPTIVCMCSVCVCVCVCGRFGVNYYMCEFNLENPTFYLLFAPPSVSRESDRRL